MTKNVSIALKKAWKSGKYSNRKLRTPKHNMCGTPTYRSWVMMKARCLNKNYSSYIKYGGNGIKIEDERWFNFENFYKDMGVRPDGTSLDRKDNNKGYCLENCRWATLYQQAYNQTEIRNNSSGIRGIVLDKQTNKYRARLKCKGKIYELGRFIELKDAILARNKAKRKYWGSL